MARVTFEVKNYTITIAREMNASTETMSLKFPAYIVCNGDEYQVVVYALDDTSPVPENYFLPERKNGLIFVPRWQFDWFVDLLRLEKPVFCSLNSEMPKWNSLSTSNEPVGEQEL